MRRFANLYIILFFIDACLSLLDELCSFYSSPMPWLTGLRVPVASLVIVLAMVLYACLGIDRRLPKRVFLPLTLYAFWCSVGMWPLSGVVGFEALGLAASFGQVILGALAFVLVQGLCGRPLLTELSFQRELFSLRNTLGFTAINLLLTPFLLLYTGLAVTGYYLEQQTAGFMRLSPAGIYMSERSYHLGDKEVRLAGMMHIGKQDYYNDLADSMNGENTIILAEGVTDEDGLLKENFNYNQLAGVVGLTSQETMKVDANLVDLDSLGASSAGQGRPDIARADIDLNQFEASTVAFLNVLGRTLLSARPLAESFAEYHSWVEGNMTPEMMTAVMSDLIDKRNETVIDSFAKSLTHYDKIIIPWGAMHMPAIEAAVLARGFRAGERRERLSLDFRTLPYAKLLKKWRLQSSEVHLLTSFLERAGQESPTGPSGSALRNP